MTQNARVVRLLENGLAEVLVERASACGGNCASCGGCAAQRALTVTAKNKIAASAGDRVVISTKTSKIILAAFVVYIVPFVLFFIGYFITAAAGLPESASALYSVAAFIIGAVIAFLYNRQIKKKRGVEFELVSFVK